MSEVQREQPAVTFCALCGACCNLGVRADSLPSSSSSPRSPSPYHPLSSPSPFHPYPPELVSTHGSDAWFTMSVEELLPERYRAEASSYRKGTDTMDVWFDSGRRGGVNVHPAPSCWVCQDSWLRSSHVPEPASECWQDDCLFLPTSRACDAAVPNQVVLFSLATCLHSSLHTLLYRCSSFMSL